MSPVNVLYDDQVTLELMNRLILPALMAGVLAVGLIVGPSLIGKSQSNSAYAQSGGANGQTKTCDYYRKRKRSSSRSR